MKSASAPCRLNEPARLGQIDHPHPRPSGAQAGRPVGRRQQVVGPASSGIRIHAVALPRWRTLVESVSAGVPREAPVRAFLREMTTRFPDHPARAQKRSHRSIPEALSTRKALRPVSVMHRAPRSGGC